MQAQSILSKISSPILAILQEIGQVGEKSSQSVYVVGGFVRDLLLGRENLDLDIVVEGDAIRFACHLAEKWGGQFQAHPQFGTGILARPDGFRMDFVTARCETYAHPGALPSVKYGTIMDDLRRRDFSMNAIALQLNPDAFGNLVDCTNGVPDLRTGRIRALHDQSFIDDPTRIFRAIRYEGRYGFQIGEADQERMREAIHGGVLDFISGQRIRHEIDRILSEEAVPKMIRRMLEFNLFRAIHSDWAIPQDFDFLWEAAHHAMDWVSVHLPGTQIDTAAMRWMALLDTACRAPTHIIESMSERLALENLLRSKLIAQEHLGNALAELSADSRPSEIYKRLKSYPLETLVFALTRPNQPHWRRDGIENYLMNLRGVQPLINGDDLIRLGLKPSPAFANLLWKTLAAQLDGEISTKPEAYQLLGKIHESESI